MPRSPGVAERFRSREIQRATGDWLDLRGPRLASAPHAIARKTLRFAARHQPDGRAGSCVARDIRTVCKICFLMRKTNATALVRSDISRKAAGEARRCAAHGHAVFSLSGRTPRTRAKRAGASAPAFSSTKTEKSVARKRCQRFRSRGGTASFKAAKSFFAAFPLSPYQRCRGTQYPSCIRQCGPRQPAP